MTSLKMGRSAFALVMAITVAGSSYLTPLIPIPEIRGFIVAVAAAVVVYIGTKEEEIPVTKTPETTPSA